MQLKNLTLTNEELRSLIPNIIHEVEGEQLLADKLAPWLGSATSWLDDSFVGPSFSLPDPLLPLAKKILVYRAFADAIPSLDVTLSPAGFAVISTEGRAPASKERVERLVASLRSFVDANLPPFLNSLLKLGDWRSTPMGEYWLAPFLHGLDEAQTFRKDNDLLTTYRLMRDQVIRFQSFLAQNYLGSALLREVRCAVYDVTLSDGHRQMWRAIHRAVMKFLYDSEHGKFTDDEHQLSHFGWHYAQPVILELKSCGELLPLWEREMDSTLNVQPFENTARGGYFF